MLMWTSSLFALHRLVERTVIHTVLKKINKENAPLLSFLSSFSSRAILLLTLSLLFMSQHPKATPWRSWYTPSSKPAPRDNTSPAPQPGTRWTSSPAGRTRARASGTGYTVGRIRWPWWCRSRRRGHALRGSGGRGSWLFGGGARLWFGWGGWIGNEKKKGLSQRPVSKRKGKMNRILWNRGHDLDY